MSSLRVESLRLCWLEAFIAVAEEENISEAARVLGVDQSTVSRHLQSLEKWLGKKLIEPGKITDPDNPRLSIGITDAGQEFDLLAQRIVEDLHQFREESSRRREITESFSAIVSKLQSDLRRKNTLASTEIVKTNIEVFQKLLDIFDDGLPTDTIYILNRDLRHFFANYETQRNLEKRKRKKGSPPPVISPEWFEQQRKQQ